MLNIILKCVPTDTGTFFNHSSPGFRFTNCAENIRISTFNNMFFKRYPYDINVFTKFNLVISLVIVT